jgi:hypothetical protein
MFWAEGGLPVPHYLLHIERAATTNLTRYAESLFDRWHFFLESLVLERIGVSGKDQEHRTTEKDW